MRQIRNDIYQSLAKRDNYLEQIRDNELKIALKKQELSDLLTIQALVQKLSEQVLSQFKISFEQCVNNCLDIIFPDTFNFSVETKISMGKCLVDLKFYDKASNSEIDPMTCCGGGVIDLLSFALRLAITALKGEQPTFIMDEPFKHLSKDKVPLLCEMLRQFSKKYQFIIVTHERGIMDCADNIVELTDEK